MHDWLRTMVPAVHWLPSYTRGDLRGDVQAGLTVGVMLIPQSMAYAVLAGVPPIYGLYASLVPLLAYALLGTSRHLAVGVVAIDMIIIAAGVGTLAEPGTTRYVALAVLLAAFTGVIQITMGAARMGFMANLLSRPVITGFTAAAALIIAASQLGNLSGMDLPRSEYVHVILWEAAAHLARIHTPTLVLGLALTAVLLAVQRWMTRLPGGLIVIVLATTAAWGLGLEMRGVEVVGAIPTGLPAPEMPDVAFRDLRELLPTALTLALVQFMTVVSLGRVFGARHRYNVRPSQELIAVGAANLLGSLFRGLPVSGSFSRSAVNERGGAKTPLANVVAASLIVLTLLFLTPLFYYLPQAALAAIIIVSAVGLVDVREVRYLFRAKQRDGYIAIFTFATTLLVGIQEGLLLGIGASMVAMLYRISRPHVAELGHLPGTQSYRNLERYTEAVRHEDILILRIDAGFSFFNAKFFKDYILEKSEGADRRVRAVIIDATGVNDLDTTAVEAVQEVSETLEQWGIDIHFASMKGPVRDVIRRAGLIDRLGPGHFHVSPHLAVEAILGGWDVHEDTHRLAGYQRQAHPPEAAPSD